MVLNSLSSFWSFIPYIFVNPFCVLYSDVFAPNIKNIEPTISNADSQALMKQVAVADFLGGWKDGILTIGTLGCDPLKSFNQNKEYYALESEDELDEDDEEHLLVDGDDEDNYNAEHEELNPLMHTTFEHDFEDVVSANHDANASQEVVVMTFNKVVLTPPVISHEAIESNEVETDQKKKKGERITLADLFLADSDVKMKLDPDKVLFQSSEKPSTLKAKHGLSFTKKLIPRVKDNPHPIKDIKKVSHGSLSLVQ